ncbi:MAG TPA: cupin domain-containing protein [Ktedonobacteraceae bacterium]|nr:cupin domain-containing protein [Ktedonobacteraceae bacterium]
MSTAHEIRVISPSERGTNGADVAADIAGNRLTRCGLIDMGGTCLKLALVQTQKGAVFPSQYHEGGNELAVILSGKGTIETEGDEGGRRVYPFEGGDLLFIPSGIAYRVVDRGEGELLAWVLFAEGAHSFWRDGSPAD